LKRRAAACAALALLVAAPAARAAYDPLAGGTTKLEVDQDFARFLRADRVQLTAVAPALGRGGKLFLPVTGGRFDPTLGKGEIEQSGSLVFSNQRKRLPVREVVVRAKRSPLIAKVGGSQLKLATAGGIRSTRNGFGAAFLATGLRLTDKLATRLNKKLRPPTPFTAGQLLGRVVSRPEPQTVRLLPVGKVTVVLDPAFAAKLDRLFVSVNPVFPAEHQGTTYTFPILDRSALAPDAAAGTVRGGGDIEFLKLGFGQIFWHEPWFEMDGSAVLAEADVEPAPSFPGKLGQVQVLSLGAGSDASDPVARRITVTGRALTLDAATATYFNEAFGEGGVTFQPGEAFGDVSFSAQAQ
jgi:hypothetical protein